MHHDRIPLGVILWCSATPPLFSTKCTDMAAEMSLLELYVGVVIEFLGIRILEGQTLVTNVAN